MDGFFFFLYMKSVFIQLKKKRGVFFNPSSEDMRNIFCRGLPRLQNYEFGVPYKCVGVEKILRYLSHII